jgi:hypothetical protein
MKKVSTSPKSPTPTIPSQGVRSGTSRFALLDRETRLLLRERAALLFIEHKC